eukprot:5174241-Amphidinium_carterae.1
MGEDKRQGSDPGALPTLNQKGAPQERGILLERGGGRKKVKAAESLSCWQCCTCPSMLPVCSCNVMPVPTRSSVPSPKQAKRKVLRVGEGLSAVRSPLFDPPEPKGIEAVPTTSLAVCLRRG